MSNVVMIIDADTHSQAQLKLCQTVKPPFKGVVDCAASQDKICSTVDAFPAFCSTSGKCVYGVQDTKQKLDDVILSLTD